MSDEPKSAERVELEARLSEVRHALRNRFAAIRNANFYIRKRASKTELIEQDKRVGAFFDLIDRELTDADALVTKRLTSETLLDAPERSDES